MSDSETYVVSSNIYEDLGFPDADRMILKAGLAMKIAEAIKAKDLSEARAAEIIGMTRPKLSKLLQGQFRGVSESTMMECLTRLGKDVEIVVRQAAHGQAGQVLVS